MLGVFLTLLSSSAGAQEPPLVRPEPLNLLHRSLAFLEQEMAGGWGPICPDLDAKHAQRVAVALAQVEDVLSFYPAPMETLRATARDHHLQVGREATRQEAELARLRYIYAYQDWVLATMKATLDLADVVSLGKDVVETLTTNQGGAAGLLSLARRQQLLDWLARANDVAQAAEGAAGLGEVAQTAGSQWWERHGRAEKWPEYKEPDFPEIKALRQATQNLHGVLDATRKYLQADAGNLVQQADRLKDMRGGLVQLAGSVAQSFGERAQAQFAARIDALSGIVRAEERNLKAAWGERRHYSVERYKVEDALGRIRGVRRSFTILVSEYFGPVSYRLYSPPSSPAAPEALRQLEKDLPGRVNTLAASLRGFTMRPPIRPRLILLRQEFAAGEAMTVTFQAPTCLPRRAWVGIVPADTPPGRAATNDERQVRQGYQRYLYQRKEGNIPFTAPTTAGAYEIRMNSDIDGTQLTSVTFSVSPAVVIPIVAPAGSALQATMDDVRSEKMSVRDRAGGR